MIATPHPKTRRSTVSPRCVRRAARVLVVEDDAEMRQWVAEMLEEEGFETNPVPDGLTAIVSLLAEGADAVVTDWRMPGFDGLRLLESTRRLAPAIPVILLTAYAEPGLAEWVCDHGAYGLLEKPFRRDELLRQVKGALASAEFGPA